MRTLHSSTRIQSGRISPTIVQGSDFLRTSDLLDLLEGTDSGAATLGDAELCDVRRETLRETLRVTLGVRLEVLIAAVEAIATLARLVLSSFRETFGGSFEGKPPGKLGP